MSGQLNVNQFALPGMEEHAHAGAKHLAEGWRFQYRRRPGRHEHSLDAVGPLAETDDVDAEFGARLQWADSEPKRTVNSFLRPGEIKWVETDIDYRGHGAAKAMHGMASDPNVYTGNDTVPVHSTDKTTNGIYWAEHVGGPSFDRKDAGHRLPVRHPYEEQQPSPRRPELPGQQELWR